MKSAQPWFLLISLCFVVAVAIPGCRPCDRSGCESMDDRASPEDVTQGLAGAGACLSDTVDCYYDDCCSECPTCHVGLRIWKSADAAVESADAAAALCESRDPDWTVEGNPRYEIALEPGYYLACSGGCIGFRVAGGMITTLNVGYSMGPATFYLSEPGAAPGDGVDAFDLECLLADPEQTI